MSERDALADIVNGSNDRSSLLVRLPALLLFLLLDDAQPSVLVLVGDGLGENVQQVGAVVDLEDRENPPLRLVEKGLLPSVGI